MIPKEKAMGYILHRSDLLPEIEEAIDIALEEQKKQILSEIRGFHNWQDCDCALCKYLNKLENKE